MGANSKTGFFDDIKDAFEAHIDARVSLLQMDATEKVSKLVSVLAFSFLAGSLFFFVLLFIGIMAGYYFASLTQNLVTGFGIVAGIYFVLIILLMMFRKKLATTVMNLTVKTIFDNSDEEDDEEDED